MYLSMHVYINNTNMSGYLFTHGNLTDHTRFDACWF